MERRKVQQSPEPSYPTLQGFGATLAPRLMLLGALCLLPLQACNTVNDVDGLMAAPSEDWGVVLPAEGSRTLGFEDGAWLEYHLDVVVENGALVDWLLERDAVLLDRADDVVEGFGSEAFSEGAELTALGQELLQALEAARDDAADAPAGDFVRCLLEVDAFEAADPEGDDSG